MKYTIYHNPRCSKSRATLALLQDHADARAPAQSIEVQIKHYLETPLTVIELEEILDRLDCSARAIIRTKQAEYRDAGLNDIALSQSQLLGAVVRQPILLERPIVLRGEKATAGTAVIGRPPEAVLKLLQADHDVASNG